MRIPTAICVDRAGHVPTFDPGTVEACDDAVAEGEGRLGQVRTALRLVVDVDDLEALGIAEQRLVATLRGLENRRPMLVETARKSAAAAEMARQRAEQAALEDLFVAVAPAFERFLVDYDAMVRIRTEAIGRGAPDRVAVGGSGGDYRGFLVTGPDGQPTASPYPSETVPVLGAADRLAELLRGDWADMVDRLRADESRPTEPDAGAR